MVFEVDPGLQPAVKLAQDDEDLGELQIAEYIVFVGIAERGSGIARLGLEQVRTKHPADAFDQCLLIRSR